MFICTKLQLIINANYYTRYEIGSLSASLERGEGDCLRFLVTRTKATFILLPSSCRPRTTTNRRWCSNAVGRYGGIELDASPEVEAKSGLKKQGKNRAT